MEGIRSKSMLVSTSGAPSFANRAIEMFGQVRTQDVDIRFDIVVYKSKRNARG